MSAKYTNEITDKFRFSRQELEKERAHRRDKVWKIFSWAATILVAVTGGIIALKTNSSGNLKISWFDRGVISGATLFLTGFASLWINQNLKILRSVDKAIAECDEVLEIKNVIPNESHRLGYTPALVLLAIAAIIALFINLK